MKPQFISIEGQDGAGKSTNIEVITDFLQHHNIDYVQTREPGGTELGEQLRSLVLGANDQQIGDMAELLLIFAARAQHLEDVILPALEKGQWVVCDRFTDATFAYQGGGRGFSFSQIDLLQNLVQGERRPDLTLLLDLPVEVGLKRTTERGQPDRFEAQQIEFKHRVRAAYLDIAEQNPNRVKVVDAGAPLEQVQADIVLKLSQLIDHAS